MTRVRIDLNISLDGYAAGEPTPDHPMGEGWGRLTSAYAATRTFHASPYRPTTPGADAPGATRSRNLIVGAATTPC